MAASSTATARSISQVSRESLLVELQGRVQTVFPAHECVPPTANSETQDYGTVGSDGPIEGATKVFQVTLQDLGTRQGGLHRINAYFYDNWAEEHSRLSSGDEIVVSGPASSLVRSDPSAESGDHPFCLVFYTAAADDMVGAVSAGGADLHGGSYAGSGDIEVTCKVIRTAGQQLAGGGGERRAGERGRGRGRGGGSAGVWRKSSYKYTDLSSLQIGDQQTNVYGVVCSFNHPHQSKGKDMTTSVSLLDETRPDSDSAVHCNFFKPTRDQLPLPTMIGDIIRIHRAKVGQYRGRPQVVGNQGASWLVIRRKQDVRQTFQRGLPDWGVGNARDGGDGAADDEDLDPDEDYLSPSGPDSRGGRADSVLPSADWEVHASSPNYTLLQEDHDRCVALRAWLVNTAPQLWLKPFAEPATSVKEIFRWPPAGSGESVSEVDLVCCLVSKHEEAGGGAGSLTKVYVSDGTGFANGPPDNTSDEQRDSALTKGVRVASGRTAWSPEKPRNPPFPAFLDVEVMEHNREWEALALTPGMWIRLRRLTITKNGHSGSMSAKMKDRASSVNPLHPMMAEVQAIASSYVTHCAKPDVNNNHSNNNNGSNVNGEIYSVARPSPGATSTERPCSPSRPARAAGQRRSPSPAAVSTPAARHVASLARIMQPRSTECLSPRTNGIRRERVTHRTGERSGRGDAGAPSGTNGVANGGGIASSGAVRNENDSGRSTKRQRLVPDSAGLCTEVEAASPNGRPTLSHLGTVRSTAAPGVFDTRVRVVSHFPPMVHEFVRPGRRRGDGLQFLFTLRLEDDYGIVDALASGPDVSRLLPGEPSPAQFCSSEDAQGKVERALARLESRTGGIVGLRLRSYVTPVARGPSGTGSGRPSACKRYSIVGPSSLEGSRNVLREG